MEIPTVPSRGSSQSAAEDPAVDLLEYARQIFRRWRLVALATAAGMLAATTYVLTAQPLYRASMVLTVVPARSAPPTEAQRDESHLAARFVPFIRNRGVLVRAAAVHGLNTPEQAWKLRGLIGRLVTTLEAPAPVIRVTLDFPDPAEGQGLLDAIATEAIQLSRTTMAESDNRTAAFLKGQLDAAVATLQQAEQQLQEFQKGASLGERRAALQSLLNQAVRLERNLEDRSIVEAELTARTNALTDLLQEEKQTLTLRRTVADDPGGAIATGRVGQGAGSTFQAEAINPVYEQLKPELARGLAELAAQQGARPRVESQLAEIRKKINGLERTLFNDGLRESRLQVNLDRSRAFYATLFEQSENARVVASTPSIDLRVLEPSDVTETPVYPRTANALAFGMALGFTIGVGLALLIVLLSEHADSRPGGRDAPSTARSVAVQRG